jgi:site-specific DNA-cytosine methylase
MTSPTPSALGAVRPVKAIPQSSVRRLTPIECERLQGFPEGWTVPATASSGTRSASRSVNGSAGDSAK